MAIDTASPKRLAWLDFGIASDKVACMFLIHEGERYEILNELLADDQAARAREIASETLGRGAAVAVVLFEDLN